MSQVALTRQFSVSLEFLVDYLLSRPKDLDYFRKFFPAPLGNDDLSCSFHVEWNLGGEVILGQAFDNPMLNQSMEGRPTPENFAYSHALRNKGVLILEAESSNVTNLYLKLSYEPLEEENLWKAFLMVFSTPKQQLREDLDRLREQVESAFIDSVLESREPESAPALKRVVTAA